MAHLVMRRGSWICLACWFSVGFGVCVRGERLLAYVGCVKCHASGNFLVRPIDVQNTRVGRSEPYNLGDLRVKWRFCDVAARYVQELPSGRCLLRGPIVLCG